jgi:ATP-dependent Clp protease adaptor protein ClpS
MQSSRILPGHHAVRHSPHSCAQPTDAIDRAACVTDAGEGTGDDSGNRGGPGQIGLATRTRAKSKKPSQFKVLMLNDDYTPMEFVVIVLKRFFNMDLEQATRVMLHVHQRGVGVCGFFPMKSPKPRSIRSWISRARTSIPCNARWKRREALPPTGPQSHRLTPRPGAQPLAPGRAAPTAIHCPRPLGPSPY